MGENSGQPLNSPVLKRIVLPPFSIMEKPGIRFSFSHVRALQKRARSPRKGNPGFSPLGIRGLLRPSSDRVQSSYCSGPAHLLHTFSITRLRTRLRENLSSMG